MDLLKDITRELRGDDESARGDDPTGRATRTDGPGESTTDAPDDFSAGDDSPSDDSPGDDSPGDDSPKDGQSGDQCGDDIHVCSFCETEFDVDRRACPECDAELVLRGER